MKIKEGFVVRTLGEKTLVVPTGEASKSFHGMIELNDTGAFIWDLVSKGLDEGDIAKKFAEKYNVDETTALNDTKEIIEKMKNAGVIEDE